MSAKNMCWHVQGLKCSNKIKMKWKSISDLETWMSSSLEYLCKHSTWSFPLCEKIYLSRVVCGKHSACGNRNITPHVIGRHTNVCYAYTHISITKWTKIVAKQIQLTIIRWIIVDRTAIIWNRKLYYRNCEFSLITLLFHFSFDKFFFFTCTCGEEMYTKNFN